VERYLFGSRRKDGLMEEGLEWTVDRDMHLLGRRMKVVVHSAQAHHVLWTLQLDRGGLLQMFYPSRSFMLRLPHRAYDASQHFAMRSNFSGAGLASLADMKPGLPDTRSARPVKSFSVVDRCTDETDHDCDAMKAQRPSRVQGCVCARAGDT
jgi:hypothetical protein